MRHAWASIAIAGTGLLAFAAVLISALAGALGSSMIDTAQSASGFSGVGVSAFALREIPPLYLRLYRAAGSRYGIDWSILAGIGKVECDHGRDPDPSCTQEGMVNSAGAGGPMQFLASTWDAYGVDTSGDGRVDRWNPADAIFGAANYLRASGAPIEMRRALLSYNHAGWYVADVEGWAARYRGSLPEAESTASWATAGAPVDGALASRTTTPVRYVAGESALLASEDGHVAFVPANVPLQVQAMIVAGNELQGLPYGPGGHPDPRDAAEEDCSSTVNYVLYRAGIRSIGEILKSNPLAQDYVSWGAPGPGRWVTIYATTAPTNHVFIVLAGLRLDTSHNGTDVGPNRFEDGPRWRILDHIPTWAHWSVRHPPGL